MELYYRSPHYFKAISCTRAISTLSFYIVYDMLSYMDELRSFIHFIFFHWTDYVRTRTWVLAWHVEPLLSGKTFIADGKTFENGGNAETLRYPHHSLSAPYTFTIIVFFFLACHDIHLKRAA